MVGRSPARMGVKMGNVVSWILILIFSCLVPATEHSWPMQTSIQKLGHVSMDSEGSNCALSVPKQQTSRWHLSLRGGSRETTPDMKDSNDEGQADSDFGEDDGEEGPGVNKAYKLPHLEKENEPPEDWLQDVVETAMLEGKMPGASREMLETYARALWKRTHWTESQISEEHPQERAVRRILDHPDVNAVLAKAKAIRGNGETATWPFLFQAVRDGDDEYVRQALECNRTLAKAYEPTSGFTALHWAAASDTDVCASLLIKAGAGVNVVEFEQRTPASLAACMGSEKAMRLLIQHNCDVNLPDVDGRTPLHWAVCEGHVGVAQMLIESGANQSATTNPDGECLPDEVTPIEFAAIKGDYDLMCMLALRGSPISFLEREHWLVSPSRQQAISALKAAGFEVAAMEDEDSEDFDVDSDPMENDSAPGEGFNKETLGSEKDDVEAYGEGNASKEGGLASDIY